MVYLILLILVLACFSLMELERSGPFPEWLLEAIKKRSKIHGGRMTASLGNSLAFIYSPRLPLIYFFT